MGCSFHPDVLAGGRKYGGGSVTNDNIYVHHKKFSGRVREILYSLSACFAYSGILGNSGLPQINELYNIFAGDQELGKYSFRVLRDGEELELSGGITFGAAKEFVASSMLCGPSKWCISIPPGREYLKRNELVI